MICHFILLMIITNFHDEKWCYVSFNIANNFFEQTPQMKSRIRPVGLRTLYVAPCVTFFMPNYDINDSMHLSVALVLPGEVLFIGKRKILMLRKRCQAEKGIPYILIIHMDFIELLNIIPYIGVMYWYIYMHTHISLYIMLVLSATFST